MYLQKAIALFALAMKNTFDGDYIDARFRDITIGIDYPEARQGYPAIWCDFEPVGALERVGIGHVEHRVEGGLGQAFTRYRFQGFATYTAIALSKRERDALFDEMVRVFAFGDESMVTRPFRETIEDNDLIAVNMDFGTVDQRGFAASPGTPWGTDEIVYEATIAMDVIGEFIADPTTATLVPITEIRVTDLREGEADTTGW